MTLLTLVSVCRLEPRGCCRGLSARVDHGACAPRRLRAMPQAETWAPCQWWQLACRLRVGRLRRGKLPIASLQQEIGTWRDQPTPHRLSRKQNAPVVRTNTQDECGCCLWKRTGYEEGCSTTPQACAFSALLPQNLVIPPKSWSHTKALHGGMRHPMGL